MAFKTIAPLPAFNGIPTAGTAATATLDVPRGPRYHSITLRVSDSNNANAATIIDWIKIQLNGKDQRYATIARLDELNSQHNEPFIHSAPTARFVAATSGGAVTTSITPYVTTRSLTTQGLGAYSLFKDANNVTWITIFFNEKWRPDPVGEKFAWPTGNVASFQILVRIAAAAGTVTMSAEAEVDDAVVSVQGSNTPVTMPMGKIVKWYETQMEVNGTTKNWTTFPYKRGQLLSVHWFDQYITNVQVLTDKIERRNCSQDSNLFRMVQNRMTGAASRYDLHLDYDDVLQGGALNLQNIQDLRFNLTLSDGTARNITTMVQILDDPD